MASTIQINFQSLQASAARVSRSGINAQLIPFGAQRLAGGIGQRSLAPTQRSQSARVAANRPQLQNSLRPTFQRLRESPLVVYALPSGDEEFKALGAAPTISSNGATSSQDSSESSSTEVTIDLELPRRSRLVTFTCNICGGRTERLVNPIAWERGMVIVQCGECQAWHKVADAANLVEEIRYADLENSDDE